MATTTSTSSRDKTASYLVTAGATLFLGGTLLLILLSSPAQLGLFGPHAPLNALAVTLFAVGISGVQAPTPAPKVREQRLNAHRNLLGGVAVPLLAVGTTFIYFYKEANSAPHGVTWHAFFGSLVIMWMLVQSIVGSAAVWVGKSGLIMYKYHRFSGYMLTTLSLITAFLGGMYSTWAVSRGPSFVLLRMATYGVGIPLIAAGLAMRTQLSKMNGLLKPFASSH